MRARARLLMLLGISHGFGDGLEVLCRYTVVQVKVTSEPVHIVDQEGTTKEIHHGSNFEITPRDESVFGVHVFHVVVGTEGGRGGQVLQTTDLPWDFLATDEDGEGVAAAVGGMDFTSFSRFIKQKVVDDAKVEFALVGLTVIPGTVETKDFAVFFNESAQTVIDGFFTVVGGRC